MTKRARLIKRAIASVMRVECNNESDGFGGKSNGNEGGRQLRVTRAMANGDNNNVGDDDGDKAGRQHRGQGQGWQGQWQR